MTLNERIDLLTRLGQYMQSDEPTWIQAREQASYDNGWFVPEFVDLSTKQIATNFLRRDALQQWLRSYSLPIEQPMPRKVGIVMAGNIPLVGFHDWLCVFISGHLPQVKPSSRDSVLIKHIIGKLNEWAGRPDAAGVITDMLKGCDAYIATGSNNSAGFFEYYFSRYPHIIRRNRTSVAVLDGSETKEELSALADDVFTYFGLGCRNVTKLYTPANYDFIPLLAAFDKYDWMTDHHKYKNNYDYNLAIHLINKKYYMSTPAILLIEEPGLFSPISQLNYETYVTKDDLLLSLADCDDLQCVMGHGLMPFGQAQYPRLADYADGVDTLNFLLRLQ